MAEARICDAGKGGTFLPLASSEHLWDPYLRASAYAVALIYIFAGVSICADRFMESLETITSSEKTVVEQGKPVKKKVWNDTVANLTLLALGSSAPEILVSVVEVILGGFKSGEIGPSTITGSAAFNLLVIVAVCVVSVPNGEVRHIDKQGVFYITAAFSVLAYVWLVVIVQVNTPDVVDLWEALATLALMPVLVYISYQADIGKLQEKLGLPQAAHCISVGDDPEIAEPELLPAVADSDEAEAERRPSVVQLWSEDLRTATLDIAEEGEKPSPLDVTVHVVLLPWKVFVTMLVPPANFLGGWPCFVMALVVLGLLSGIVVDAAKILGCCLDIEESIVAITFVALGTSMPDLFASKIAAVQDDTADASIVNVTGSNSVNVFLGVGLPWTICAAFWAAKGPTADNPSGVFEVHGGDLGFNVVVFAIAALIALGVIQLRRVKLGGELGGHVGLKWLSALLLVSLWVFFISLATWNARSHIADVETQVWMIQRGLFFLENLVIVFALLLVMGTKFNGQTKFVDQSVQADFFALEKPDKSSALHGEALVRSWRVMVQVAKFLGRLRSKKMNGKALWRRSEESL